MKKVLSMILVIAMALSLGVVALADPIDVDHEAGETYYEVTETWQSLPTIAEKILGNPNRWPEIWARNRDKVPNVNGVAVGTVLAIPNKASTPLVPDAGCFYIVQPGDKLTDLAMKVWGNTIYWEYIFYNEVTQMLVTVNRAKNLDDINVGDEIYIPVIPGVRTIKQRTHTVSVTVPAYGYRYFEIAVYTVKKGDTLDSIAEAVYGDKAYASYIYANNKNAVELALEESPRSTIAMTDENTLPVGGVLFIPNVERTLPGAMDYTVVERAFVRLWVQTGYTTAQQVVVDPADPVPVNMKPATIADL